MWLYAGDLELFPPRVRQDLEESELLISPIVPLELEYLCEIDRTTVGSREVIEELQRTIGLQISDTPFVQVISQSLLNTWTRNPFDRIKAAQAALEQSRLPTRARMMRDHYEHAYWGPILAAAGWPEVVTAWERIPELLDLVQVLIDEYRGRLVPWGRVANPLFEESLVMQDFFYWIQIRPVSV